MTDPEIEAFQAARGTSQRLAGQVAVVTGSSRGIGRGIVLALAGEVASHYINVNAVVPGEVGTTLNPPASEGHPLVKGRFPWPVFPTPADIGRAVAFLSSDDAAVLTGVLLRVDGGEISGGMKILDAVH